MADWSDYGYAGLTVRSCVELPGVECLAPQRRPDVVVEWGAVPQAGPPPGARESWTMAGGTLVIVIQDVGRFRVCSGSEVLVDPDPNAHARDLALYLMGPVFGAICHLRGVLPLHASAVATGMGCVAFAGSSGTGKSTIAGFLTRRGFGLVADDVCVVAPGDAVAVWPGPPRLKLSTDGLEALSEDWSVLTQAGGTRERYQLARERNGVGSNPVPLRRLYIMEDGTDLRLEPVVGLDAVQAVTSQTYCLGFVDPLGVSAGHFQLSANIARQLEIRRLIRPRGFQHMDRILHMLESDWQ